MNEIHADGKPQSLAGFLSDHWLSQRFKRSKVEALKAELNEAMISFRDSASDAKRKIAKRLAAGETTGELLQDELILWGGLDDKDGFDKFLAFDQKLIAAKDQELLLICRHSIPDFPNDLEGRSDPLSNWGYVFGVLSGERLRIPDAPRDPIFLPFERHFLWGWRGERGSGLTVAGPLELMTFIEPSVSAFSDWVLGKGQTTIPSMEDLDQRQTKMFIFVGAEITEEALRGTGSRLTLDELETVRKGLNAPSEAEKALAEAI